MSDLRLLVDLHKQCTDTYSKIRSLSVEVTRAIQAQNAIEKNYQMMKSEFVDGYAKMLILRPKLGALNESEIAELKEVDNFMSHIKSVCDPDTLQHERLTEALDSMENSTVHDAIAHYNGIRTIDHEENEVEDDDQDSSGTDYSSDDPEIKQKKIPEAEHFPNGIRYVRYGKQSKYRLDPDQIDQTTMKDVVVLFDRLTTIN